MTNLDAMCQLTLDRHQQLIAAAARRRLASSGLRDRPHHNAAARHWRLALAAWLRGAADRLEPVPDRAEVAMLRAVAHREISVDQALSLMDARNGHRSAIV